MECRRTLPPGTAGSRAGDRRPVCGWRPPDAVARSQDLGRRSSQAGQAGGQARPRQRYPAGQHWASRPRGRSSPGPRSASTSSLTEENGDTVHTETCTRMFTEALLTKASSAASLLVQRLRPRAPHAGARVPPLVRGLDPTCRS